MAPSIAGSVAAFTGARQVFFLDAVTFFVAAVLIFTLPGQLRVESNQQPSSVSGRTWRDIKDGTTRLLSDAPIRYALFIQLVTSIMGAQILVNTVGYVQGTLKLGNVQYGWVMTAFGIGAMLSAVAFGAISQRFARTTFILFGAVLIILSLLPANYVSLSLLIILSLLPANYVSLSLFLYLAP